MRNKNKNNRKQSGFEKMVEERKKKQNSCYLFCIRQVAQGSQSKTSTKIKVDLRRKNSSNSIHGKENLRAKKTFKREINPREKVEDGRRKKKQNSCYLFCILQVAQGSQSKTSTKIKVDLRRKNPSNNIHGKENLRAKKPFKREIDLREKPKFNTSRTKRKVYMRTW